MDRANRNHNMKRLLFILFLAVMVLGANAATILFSVTNSDLTPCTNYLIITPVSPPIYVNGSWSIRGKPTRLPLYDGTNALRQLQGTYWASNQNYEIYYAVPTNDEPYHAEALAVAGGIVSDFFPTNWVVTSQLNTASNALQTQIDGIVSGGLSYDPQFGSVNLTNWSMIDTNVLASIATASNVITQNFAGTVIASGFLGSAYSFNDVAGFSLFNPSTIQASGNFNVSGALEATSLSGSINGTNLTTATVNSASFDPATVSWIQSLAAASTNGVGSNVIIDYEGFATNLNLYSPKLVETHAGNVASTTLLTASTNQVATNAQAMLAATNASLVTLIGIGTNQVATNASAHLTAATNQVATNAQALLVSTNDSLVTLIGLRDTSLSNNLSASIAGITLSNSGYFHTSTNLALKNADGFTVFEQTNSDLYVSVA
jgi:hypothetical protein